MPFDREGTLRKAEQLRRQGKLEAAIAEYRALVDEQPADWNTANTLGDLYVQAGAITNAVIEYNKIAVQLGAQGFFAKAAALYKKILKVKPDEDNVLWHMSTMYARQGLMAEARAQLTALAGRRRAQGDADGEAEVRKRLGDFDLTSVESQILGGRIADGLTLLERLLSDDPARRDRAVAIGCSIAEVNADAGYQCIDVAVRSAIAANDWRAAASALGEFAKRAPDHVAALTRLAEVRSNGSLADEPIDTSMAAAIEPAPAAVQTDQSVEPEVPEMAPTPMPSADERPASIEHVLQGLRGQADSGGRDLARAIEWYEQAIDALPPDASARHALQYDLALLLDSNGERARTLAVLSELQAGAGDYRDVASRLEQLKEQMGAA